MHKLLINDTADAVVRRKKDDHLFLTAETQLSSLSSALGISEKIHGGIGAKPLAIFKGQKEITTTLRNAFFDPEMVAMTQGVEIEDGEALVWDKENGLTVEDGSVSIKGQPSGRVIVRDIQGNQIEADAGGGEITVPEDHAKDGEIVEVWYQKTVTGKKLEYNSDKFAGAHSIDYHTIALNAQDTSEVAADIYIKLFHVIPNDETELNFENGTAQAPEISFEALANPGTDKIGELLIVPRENGEQQTPPTTP